MSGKDTTVSNEHHATLDWIGIVGPIHVYHVTTLRDVLVVERDWDELARTRVDGSARVVRQARMLTLGRSLSPDDAEVIFLRPGERVFRLRRQSQLAHWL